MPLRPTFFRLRGQRCAYSGWRELKRPNIWATKEVVLHVATDIEPEDASFAERLRALEPQAWHQLYLVPLASIALNYGERVELTQELDLTPHGVVCAGERGVVGRVDPETGERRIFLEQYHYHLCDYSNCMWLIPHATDELLVAVRLYESASTTFGTDGVAAPGDGPTR